MSNLSNFNWILITAGTVLLVTFFTCLIKAVRREHFSSNLKVDQSVKFKLGKGYRAGKIVAVYKREQTAYLVDEQDKTYYLIPLDQIRKP